MCVVAKRFATNWIVYTNSCAPKHIIYWHCCHKKGNFFIDVLKKKIDIRPLTFKTKIKEKTVLQKHCFWLLLGRVLLLEMALII